MKIIKGNIKFSDLPIAEQKSEIEWDAIHWEEIFKNEEAWKDWTHNDYRKQAKMVLIADEDTDCNKYSFIELENGRRKWVRNEDLERVEEDEKLGIY